MSDDFYFVRRCKDRGADDLGIGEVERLIEIASISLADAEVERILTMPDEEVMEGVTEQDIVDMRNGVTAAVRLVDAEKRVAELEAALKRIVDGLPDVRAAHRFSEARAIARAALGGSHG